MLFLSHNAADKEVARSLAVLLLSAKCDVWLDEWRIAPGDSIVHEMNVGLENALGLILLWSHHAAASSWVRTELNAAVTRRIEQPTFRIVPVVLDGTPLPPLLADTAWVDWGTNRGEAMIALLRGLGISDPTRRSVLRGVNLLLTDLEARVEPYFGIVSCPECGGEKLKVFTADDEIRGDRYLCIQCEECSWEDGGEI